MNQLFEKGLRIYKMFMSGENKYGKIFILGVTLYYGNVMQMKPNISEPSGKFLSLVRYVSRVQVAIQWFRITIIGNKQDRKLRGVTQKLLYLETYKDIHYSTIRKKSMRRNSFLVKLQTSCNSTISTCYSYFSSNLRTFQ